MGRNNLKKIRVVLKNKSTSTAPRAGNDSDLYKIRFASARFNSIGGSPGTGGTLYAINQLTEATSVDFDVNEYIDPSVGYVGVQFYMSASTTSDRFATDATTGIADIQYIIEKLN
jgi:hypothetical protein